MYPYHFILYRCTIHIQLNISDQSEPIAEPYLLAVVGLSIGDLLLCLARRALEDDLDGFRELRVGQDLDGAARLDVERSVGGGDKPGLGVGRAVGATAGRRAALRNPAHRAVR